jgi:hypothetical protein
VNQSLVGRAEKSAPCVVGFSKEELATNEYHGNYVDAFVLMKSRH